MGHEPVFCDLQDTPIFQQTVNELQGSAKKLKERCSGLLSAARKYRDALAFMTEAQGSFATALAEFGCGSDEDSLIMGSAVMSQFVKAFRELTYAYSFIAECVDKDMIEVLQATWLDGHLAALREEGKKFDRRCADHEAARLRHLALKKVVKREVLERSTAELAATRAAADEARYELARHLNTVEVAKRHAFLTMVVGVVAQHLVFFRQGAALLERMEAPYSDAMAISEHLRKEGAAKQQALEDMIRVTREMTAAREAAIARESATAATPPPPSASSAALASIDTDGAYNPSSSMGGAPLLISSSSAAAAAAAGEGASDSEGAVSQQQQPQVSGSNLALHGSAPNAAGSIAACTGSPLASQGTAGGSSGLVNNSSGGFVAGLGLGVAASAMIAATPGGPVQLTAAAASLLSDIERLILATQQSGGQRVTIIKQGYLTKKSQGKGRHDWKRRFFVLDSTGMMYYYSHKAADSAALIGGLAGRSSTSRPKNTLPLLTSTVKMDAEDPGMRCCFRVVSPEGTYTLQAESEYERAEWIAALQGVIGVLLNGSLDLSSLPRIPLRPTHSRHNSYSDLGPELALLAGSAGASSVSSASQPGSPMSGASVTQDTGGGRSSSGGGGLMAAATAAMGPGGSTPLPPSPLGRLTSTSAGGEGFAAAALGANSPVTNSQPGRSSIPTSNSTGSSMGRPSSSSSSFHHHHRSRSHSSISQQQLQQPLVQQPLQQQQQQQEGRQSGVVDLQLDRTQQQQQHQLLQRGHSTAGSSSNILERLKRLPGNRACADCGAPEPDWASLNLAILLCIECSGVHRQLGVHISKVRSTTLDVKDWKPPVPDVFEALGGNSNCNAVWEAELPRAGAAGAAAAASGGGSGSTGTGSCTGTPRAATTAAAAAAAGGGGGVLGVKHSDSWVWDSEDEVALEQHALAAAAGADAPDSSLRRQGRGGDEPSQLKAAAETAQANSNSSSSSPKPLPTAGLPEKQRYIQDKYVNRRFVCSLPKEAAQAKLWDAVEAADARLALQALAGGADINAPYRTPRAHRLVRSAISRDKSPTPSPKRPAGSAAAVAQNGSSVAQQAAADSGKEQQPQSLTCQQPPQQQQQRRWPRRSEDEQPDTPSSWSACGTVSVLHAAAAAGDRLLLEFLLQNGASWQQTDAGGRSALHYAILYDAVECAKQLLRRGGSELAGIRDSRGQSAMDLCLAKGRVEDEELFLLLSG